MIITNKFPRDTVLMIQKNRPFEQIGKLNFPGGKIEPGESPKMAAIREVMEETGVDLAPFIDALRPVGLLRTGEHRVEFFEISLPAEELQKARSMTDEKISFQSTREMLQDGWQGSEPQKTVAFIPLFMQLALQNCFYTVVGEKENAF